MFKPPNHRLTSRFFQTHYHEHIKDLDTQSEKTDRSNFDLDDNIMTLLFPMKLSAKQI